MPRSALLALWFARVADRSAAVDETQLARGAASVRGDDEPHTVQLAADDSDAGQVPLVEIMRAWGTRLLHVIAVFPASGDVAGVPAVVSGPAVEAEECVLVALAPVAAGDDARSDDPDGLERHAPVLETWALIPAITPFGSEFERGHLVTWEAVPVPPWHQTVMATVGDLREAERELRSVLIQATEALDALDIAAWSSAAQTVLEGLTGYRALVDLVPEDLEQRRARVLSESARLRFILDVATRDDGGSINLWQADQRSAALRHIDHVARRAMSAATHADLSPARPH